jgi:amino acid adenylation domain-containing protein
MVGHLGALLVEMAGGDELRLEQLAPLPAPESRLLGEWSGPPAGQEPPRVEPVHERFAALAASVPHATALCWGGGSLTYGELASEVTRLARRLAGAGGGVGHERRIGICLERSPERIASVLAVLEAGAAYVPLDPEYPAQRLAFMVEDAGLAAIVTRSALRPRLPASAALLCLDEEVAAGREGGAPEGASGGVRPGPRDLAYVIYTSGSTGRPKGVLVEHGGLGNVIAHAAAALELGPGKCVLQAASLSFDASALEIFTALTSGAALCLVDGDTLRDGERLGESLRRHRVSTLIAVPSLLDVLAPDALPDVTAVMAGGEACSAETAARWGRGRRFFNAYAPTETTIYSTLERHAGGPDQAPGVGRPIPGATVHLLDRALRRAPAGTSAELFVGGVGVARGYHGLPALTAERFVPDPFAAEPGGRLYRTGDVGRWREDGTLELLGRRDAQVKVRGHRVELGEVESALVRHPAVREAVVVLRDEAAGAAGQGRLAAYVVPEPRAVEARADTELDGELRAHLRQHLPEPMVPAAIVVLDALPRLPSGKLDRRALPAPETPRPARTGGRIRPRTESERGVAAVWSEVLKLEPEQVGIHDNFFDLGGHSLLAIQVQSRLADRLGRKVAIVELFRHPTIRDLARHLDGGCVGEGIAESTGAGAPPAPVAVRVEPRAAAARGEQRRRRGGARRASEPEPVP